MKTTPYPVRQLTPAEDAVVCALSRKLADHFDPQIEAQVIRIQEAEAAAQRAILEYNANPRAQELGAFFWGPDAPKRELKASDPEKYASLRAEWGILSDALHEAKGLPQTEKNDLEDMQCARLYQAEQAMFLAGKALGRAEGARLTLDFLLPQLRQADLAVILTPALLTLITATDTALLEMEGGAVEC